MATKDLPDGIAILDFGGQYCHLIARRVRELNVFSEILPSDAKRADIEALGSVMNLKGVIFSGSPSSVKAQDALTLDPEILEMTSWRRTECIRHRHRIRRILSTGLLHTFYIP